MDTTFHMNWLRENASGHLDADLGAPVHSHQLELALIGLLPSQQPGKTWNTVNLPDLNTPWRLPEWARRRVELFFGGEPRPAQLAVLQGVCDRIRDKAWNTPESSLFLPYFGRREWNERFSLLPQIGFQVTPDGVVAEGVKPNSVEEIAIRTAAAVYVKSTAPVPVRFESRLPLADPWRGLLLERYGLELPAGAPPLSRLVIQSSGEDGNAWGNTPRERHCHYYSVFSRMALAVQYSLRRWIMPAFAQTVDSLTDFDNGADLLVYAAIRPHAKKRARDFSYDVLNAEMMDFAFGRATRRLEPMLETASTLLTAAGREDDARLYLRNDIRLHAARMTQRARRRSRVRTLLVSEGVLIYSMMKFANRLKLLDTPKAVIGAARELADDFNDRISKIFFFLPRPEELGTMIFLESTNAIHSALGGPQALRIHCETADGSRYEATQPMSECLAPI